VSEKDLIVVLHGIARTWRSMNSLANFLRSQGYPLLNVGYPSTRIHLESLIDHIQHQVTDFNRDHHRKIHFIGYSLGGLLARGVIHRYRPPNLGRVVQLAPPNQGSEVADFWKNNFLFKWIFGPAGQDLGAEEKSFARILGPVDYELGVIAGNRSWDPISSAMIKGPNDGKVSVESTKVAGLTDHITIAATHTFIIYNREAWNQTVQFLECGKFNRNSTS
jgi:triacylglycerol esterase/lipase EstA (alpha/beta hydrolase family)